MNSASSDNKALNANYRYLFLWYALSATVVVMDLITKKMASDAMSLYERINILPIFDFTLRHNYGAAFSFLAGQSGWQVWFLGIVAGGVSIAIAIWIFVIGKQRNLEAFGLALILGGALGNLYDRVTLGYVVDFILFYYRDAQFPAFNIADSAITCGVGVLLLDMYRKAMFERNRRKAEVE